MTSRVLLICPEPLGHQQPAGVGIRFLEFARTLKVRGHEVSVLSPDAGSVEGCAAGSLSPENLRKFSASHDVAILQGHVINEFVAHAADIPLVIDLYDPFLIENLHYSRSHGAEVFEHDHATLLRSLAAGDFFLCASQSQRLFYLGLLLASRRLNPESFAADPTLHVLLDTVPFGVPPPREKRRKSNEAEGLLFGGIYDWYDPILAIDAVMIAREQFPNLTLTFTRHPNPSLTPQGAASRAMEYARENGLSFVRFEPWVPYADRAAYYDRFSAAILTFQQSLETDLSMRTRIFDYLWGGLPVISSSAPGTDEVLLRYGGGIIVNDEKAASFAEAIKRLLVDAGAYQKCLDGAERFVAEHQWPLLMQPLLRFLQNPVIDRHKPGDLPPDAAGRARRGVLRRLKRKIGGRF